MSNKRTLFISSNPDPRSPLAVAKEFNRVREKLGAVDPEWSRAIDHWPDVRLDQLPTRLLDYEPAIIHFSGHGKANGALVMRDPDGRAGPMQPAGLAALLGEFDSVRMVVLNACYSEALAFELVRHIDVVVGMRTEVKDEAAVLFAPSFYEALAQGRSVEKAFKIAKALVATRHVAQANNPRCHSREGIDPAQIFFKTETPREPPDRAGHADEDKPRGGGPVSIKIELTLHQRDGLTNIILESRYLLQREDRQLIVERLRTDIRVQVRDIANPRAAISALIDTCNRFAGGIDELIEALRYYEQSSRLMAEVDAWTHTVK